MRLQARDRRGRVRGHRPAARHERDLRRPSLAVLREERLLEARLAADEVEQLVARRRPDDRRDRARRRASRRTWSSADDVGDAGQRLELAERAPCPANRSSTWWWARSRRRLDAVDLDEPAVADDRDAVAGPLDLGQDVARQEDRAALGLRLADERVERLLDERVEARRRLVEDQQLRAGAGAR